MMSKGESRLALSLAFALAVRASSPRCSQRVSFRISSVKRLKVGLWPTPEDNDGEILTAPCGDQRFGRRVCANAQAQGWQSAARAGQAEGTDLGELVRALAPERFAFQVKLSFPSARDLHSCPPKAWYPS
jgi:hypothetical protein